jgi:hypothetical protein
LRDWYQWYVEIRMIDKCRDIEDVYLVIRHNKIDDMPEKPFRSEGFTLLQLLGRT